MPDPRPTPFSLVFGATASERFPAVRTGLAAAGIDPRDRDAFLLTQQVAELLRELRPEAGVGAAVETLVALLHHAYLFWMTGENVQVVSDADLDRMLSVPTFRPSALPTSRPPVCRYVQLPPLRVWANPVAGQLAEPLDGWFASRSDTQLSLLAVFGLNPAREGLTAAEVVGPRPGTLQRLDGSALFSPLLPGGAAAGLASLAGEEELLELAWRAEEAL